MRFFLHVSISFSLLFMLFGCAHTNAFTRFDFTPIKERATSSLRTSEISLGKQSLGVISAIYLNDVKRKKYNGMEYFYISLYIKSNEKLDDPNLLQKTATTLKLNGKLPVKIEELPQNNQFKDLIPLDNSWNRYYVVAFDTVQEEHLSLILQSDRFSSQPLNYLKDER